MNHKYKILLVEDEETICSVIAAMLETEGYRAIQARTGELAKALFTSHLPDLVILDLGLPDIDGMEVLDFVREKTAVPVIVLSARTYERDKVLALDRGANDYVTKPFGPAELMARVRSALRNSRGGGETAPKRFVLRDLEIDYDARRIFVGGEEMKLTQTEYNIVAFLSEHNGKMMTYSAIIKAIWGYPDEGSVKKLQVNMVNIRRKLGIKPGTTGYIINELGVGYRMEEGHD